MSKVTLTSLPMAVHAGLNVRELKPEYGDRLSFMGNIGHDEMLLPDDEMEAIIADELAIAGKGGGYVYHSGHSIAPDVPFEQIIDQQRARLRRSPCCQSLCCQDRETKQDDAGRLGNVERVR